MDIREERAEDHGSISRLTQQAFEPMSFSDGTEHEVIDSLRLQNALALSLVAESGDELLGHVAFSKASVLGSSESWFALGPISVHPAHQRKGIGSDLIGRGLEELQRLDAVGCILVGDPGYYSRFGFKLAPERCPPGQPRENFMVKTIGDSKTVGAIDFHPVFQSH